MIEEKLEQTIELFRSLELAQQHLENTQTRINSLHAKLTQLDKIVDREYKDVEKLEKLSLEGLFRKVLGNKEEQIEKERQEYLTAVLNYNECKKSLELLDYERKILKDKLKDFHKTKSLLHSLIRKREQSLSKENPEASALLTPLNEQNDLLIIRKKGLIEAQNIGKKIKLIMDDLIQELNKISTWGFHNLAREDIRRKSSNPVKRIRQKIYVINQLLSQFEDELSNIYKKQDIYISSSIKTFQNFSSSFYDNMISDWILLMRIHDTSNLVKQVQNKIIRIYQSLEKEQLKIDKMMDKLAKDKERIILKYN